MIQDKDLSLVATLPVRNGGLKGFLDAASVWINKPHVANKRLSGTKIVEITSADSLTCAEEIITKFLSDIRQNNTLDSDKTRSLEVDLKQCEEKIVIVFRQLLPKQLKLFPGLWEAVVCDQSSQKVTFLPLCYATKPGDDSNRDVWSVASEVIYSFTFLQQSDGNSSIQLSCKPPQKLQTTEGGKEKQHPHLPTPDPNAHLPLYAHPHATVPWLRDTLTRKLQRWTEQGQLTTAIRSLRLVGVDRYSRLYTELKDKYGPELVKNWTESTDPQKFVYEDIGIAAYLLLLWEEDRQRSEVIRGRQSFVDLGCGNGLLVYILSKEGHSGIGIDLRKRKIWESFGSDITLQERPITPSADNLFPEFDWIIGNHSDELTPWIPVIAARSSYTCSYFVLPCCPHDFNCRFNSKVKGESNYGSYLTYVGQVGHACGFQVEEDTLRIPSTKRVCHIGRHRTYPPEQETVADQKRQQFIDERCAQNAARKTTNTEDEVEALHEKNLTTTTLSPSLSSRTSLKRSHEDVDKDDNDGCEPSKLVPGDGKDEEDNNDSNNDKISNADGDCGGDCGGGGGGGKGEEKKGGVWAENFEARSGGERVRNCQRVSTHTKDRVVREVFRTVLTADDATEVQVKGHEGRRWRRGGSVPLSTVAGMLDNATREELKSECGGVQTLLRNHSNVFQVSGGRVQLRDFSQADPWSPHSRARKAKGGNTDVWKVALCWFHDNHPDGCPRDSAQCSFAHGDSELRPRPPKNRR